MTEQTKPTDVFTDIANDILENLKDRRGVGNELEAVEGQDPECYQEIVSTISDKIHKGITEFVDANYLKDVKEDYIITSSCSVAKAELKTLFQRNMNAVASI